MRRDSRSTERRDGLNWKSMQSSIRQSRSKTFWARPGKIATNLLVTLLLCLLVSEAMLRVPLLFGTDRSIPGRDAQRRLNGCDPTSASS